MGQLKETICLDYAENVVSLVHDELDNVLLMDNPLTEWRITDIIYEVGTPGDYSEDFPGPHGETKPIPAQERGTNPIGMGKYL
ncbi:hypothetical protein GF420_15790 [candidate division GN15 bacterium]|nr:hypothetical protein [candidate division GN15 bacterium]